MKKLILFFILIGFALFANNVYAFCDINITWSSNTTYTMNQNNTYYCLNQSWYIEGVTAINTTSNLQNSTLDCLGYNIDSNDTSGTYGVYLTGISTKNNTVKNCNITDFEHGICLLDGPNNNTIKNSIASDNTDVGFYTWNSSYNTLTNNTANYNTVYGFWINGNSSYNTLTNNTANYNMFFGFVTQSNSNYNNLTNNTANYNNDIGFIIITNYNRLTNNTAKSNGGSGLEIYYGNNNTLINNIATDNSYGILLHINNNNTIIGGSIWDNQYDYALEEINSENYFRDTNFTASRTIYFNNNTDWFNYNNATDDGIWLKTNVSVDQTTITRKLTSWTQSLMQWNDTNSSAVTARYNITGLFANTNYTVYNDSVSTYNLTTGSEGNLSFTIYLSSEHEIKVETLRADGSSCTLASQCSGGYCVHNICRSTSFFCGDGYCDSGESCDICVSDCGICPGEGPPPSPPPEVNIPPPQEPTEIPEIVIELPDLPPLGEPITLPEAGTTIRLEPSFVITLYPLTNLTAVVHNISKIEEPSRYKILLCNQTLISSYEIEITVDLAYFCANYSGYPIEDPTVNIFKFIENDWMPLKTEDIAKNSIKKIICGKMSFTPYMVTGFAPTIDSKTALIAIQTCNNTIMSAIEQGIDVTRAKEFLDKAWMEYYSCNYAKAKELADKGLESLVVPPTWLIPVSFVAIAIVAIAWFWYYTVRIKVRVKK